VLIDVVVRKRLFDHQQIQILHLFEQAGVVQGVSRIGVDHQRDAGNCCAHGARIGEVAARFDFDLDAPIADFTETQHALYQLFR